MRFKSVCADSRVLRQSVADKARRWPGRAHLRVQLFAQIKNIEASRAAQADAGLEPDRRNRRSRSIRLQPGKNDRKPAAIALLPQDFMARLPGRGRAADLDLILGAESGHVCRSAENDEALVPVE